MAGLHIRHSVDGMTHRNSRNALITGASRGLGAAVATALAADGWTLLLTARGEADLTRVAESIGARPLVGDVTDPAHRAALAAELDRMGGPDLVVNNASSLGATPLPRIADYPLDELPELFAGNVFAPIALIQELLPRLRENNAAVINISSDAATGGYEGWSAYGASKAALDQFSNVLAAEEPQLAVWWLDPGEMNTAMLADAVGPDAEEAPPPSEVAVPAIRALLRDRPDSGRYTAASLVAPVEVS